MNFFLFLFVLFIIVSDARECTQLIGDEEMAIAESTQEQQKTFCITITKKNPTLVLKIEGTSRKKKLVYVSGFEEECTSATECASTHNKACSKPGACIANTCGIGICTLTVAPLSEGTWYIQVTASEAYTITPILYPLIELVENVERQDSIASVQPYLNQGESVEVRPWWLFYHFKMAAGTSEAVLVVTNLEDTDSNHALGYFHVFVQANEYPDLSSVSNHTKMDEFKSTTIELKSSLAGKDIYIGVIGMGDSRLTRYRIKVEVYSATLGIILGVFAGAAVVAGLIWYYFQRKSYSNSRTLWKVEVDEL